MYIVHVQVHVKPEKVEEFRQASIENAQNSVQEPGILRFDVLQQMDDPARFILEEVYRSPEDQIKHRETPHYLKWRDAVAGLMAEPRVGIKFQPVFPEERAWV
jgi:quinol monooxygenase YgiN